MKISDILDIKSIDVGFVPKNKEELLTYMLQLASFSNKIINKEEALKEIFARESILSTGVGKGIALPHAKTKSVKESVGALVILQSSIDYDSLDGQPVNIIFLLLGLENNVGIHLKLLSKISRLLNNDIFREDLLNCQSPEHVIRLLKKMEDKD